MTLHDVLTTAAQFQPMVMAHFARITWMQAPPPPPPTIASFFGNLYNDLTAFALAMATFFFAWAALLYMASNQNENHRTQARSTLYVALSGLALAMLAQTIATLINAATGH